MLGQFWEDTAAAPRGTIGSGGLRTAMPTTLLALALATMLPGTIHSFETPADVAAAQARGTRVTATREHVTDGAQALQVEFLPGEWPNVYFAASSPWDWRGTGGLALDVTNP